MLLLAEPAEIPPGHTSRANPTLEVFKVSPRAAGTQSRLRAAAGQPQELEASKQGVMREVAIKQSICKNLEDNEVRK